MQPVSHSEKFYKPPILQIIAIVVISIINLFLVLLPVGKVLETFSLRFSEFLFLSVKIIVNCHQV